MIGSLCGLHVITLQCEEERAVSGEGGEGGEREEREERKEREER